jgi:predicted amidophosphoribosyltransferase
MTNLCAVCGLAMDENRALCNNCGREYHFALRIDAQVTDCGDAWIDEEVQALVFGCNVCLGRVPAREAARRYARRTDISAAELLRRRARRKV